MHFLNALYLVGFANYIRFKIWLGLITLLLQCELHIDLYWGKFIFYVGAKFFLFEMSCALTRDNCTFGWVSLGFFCSYVAISIINYLFFNISVKFCELLLK